MTLLTADRNVYTVSRLNEMVKGLLEHNLPPLWVEGEVSNFSAPRSGHWYFTLKDAQAQVRCAMWRSRAMTAGFIPRDGDQVLVRANAGLYEPRGEYQLTVERMQPAGLGALQKAFEQLKDKLQKEGLFDGSRKRSLPPLPRRIGILTSPTGAALHDILTTVARRYPLGEALLYPIPVQGKEAAPAIVAALATAARRAECDVLILARGGGSLEDLWPFNEEAVARAIAASPIPVISGVGHETDFTIADFVADLRAPTPTGAAEQVTPDQQAWQRTLTQQQERLRRSIAQQQADLTQQTRALHDRLTLQHPARRLAQWAQRLDELDLRAIQALRLSLATQQQRLQTVDGRLRLRNPAQQLQILQQRLQHLQQRLPNLGQTTLEQSRRKLQLATRSLDVLSPLKTLERGYAIALQDGHPVTRAQDVSPGSPLQLRLHEGQLSCTVNSTKT